MKMSAIVVIVGALGAMFFAFANLGMYLIWPPSQDWTLFILLMVIAAGAGALPGLMIGWLTKKR